MTKRRHPSKLIRIGDLLKAQEVEVKNPFEDEERRYIVLNKDPLFRVKIFGTVVSRREGETSKENASGSKKYLLLEVDDGTGTITVALFGMTSVFDKIRRGDIVDIVGRPRSYNDRISVTAQSVQIVDIDFELYQRVNLLEIESGEEGFEPEGRIPKYLTLSEFEDWRSQNSERINEGGDLPSEMMPNVKDQVFEIIKNANGISKEEIMEILSYSGDAIDAAIHALRSEGMILTPNSGKFVPT